MFSISTNVNIDTILSPRSSSLMTYANPILLKLSQHPIWVAIIVLFCTLTNSVCAETLVCVVRYPSYILLSADSRGTQLRDSEWTCVSLNCKIGQERNMFFTIIGLRGMADMKLDVQEFIREACKSSKTITEATQRLVPAIEPIYEMLLHHLDGSDYRKLVNKRDTTIARCVLVGFEDEIPMFYLIKVRVRKSDDTIITRAIVEDLGGKAFPKDTIRFVSNTDLLSGTDMIKQATDVPATMRLITHLVAEHSPLTVAMPATILRINRDSSYWIDKEPESKCPEIQPYWKR